MLSSLLSLSPSFCPWVTLQATQLFVIAFPAGYHLSASYSLVGCTWDLYLWPTYFWWLTWVSSSTASARCGGHTASFSLRVGLRKVRTSGTGWPRQSNHCTAISQDITLFVSRCRVCAIGWQGRGFVTCSRIWNYCSLFPVDNWSAYSPYPFSWPFVGPSCIPLLGKIASYQSARAAIYLIIPFFSSWLGLDLRRIY